MKRGLRTSENYMNGNLRECIVMLHDVGWANRCVSVQTKETAGCWGGIEGGKERETRAQMRGAQGSRGRAGEEWNSEEGVKREVMSK